MAHLFQMAWEISLLCSIWTYWRITTHTHTLMEEKGALTWMYVCLWYVHAGHIVYMSIFTTHRSVILLITRVNIYDLLRLQQINITTLTNHTFPSILQLINISVTQSRQCKNRGEEQSYITHKQVWALSQITQHSDFPMSLCSLIGNHWQIAQAPAMTLQ